MSYKRFIKTRTLLEHAKLHLRSLNGIGNTKVAVARNQAVTLLNDAQFALLKEYAIVPRKFFA